MIIRRAVTDAGLDCIRADDGIHSGLIDKPMYELLLEADVVIADLSTANPNALYELGVRHALRPHQTIVIAENELKYPFDLHHVVIRPYHHLGKYIDAEEGDRARDELKKAIETALDPPPIDSPVYTYLPHLKNWQTLPQEAAAAVATPSCSTCAPPFPTAAKRSPTPSWPNGCGAG